jgi:hypothetical protein
MTVAIARRERDGSIHYSHCYGEDAYGGPSPGPARSRLSRNVGMQRGMRAFGAALALATAMFWGTMLVDPPTSGAGLTAPSSAACVEARRRVGIWFDTELQRRAFAQAHGPANFEVMLPWFRTAQNQCASGLSDESLQNFRALETMIAVLENNRLLREEDGLTEP